MMWADAHRSDEDDGEDQDQGPPIGDIVPRQAELRPDLAALAKALGIRYIPPVRPTCRDEDA